MVDRIKISLEKHMGDHVRVSDTAHRLAVEAVRTVPVVPAGLELRLAADGTQDSEVGESRSLYDQISHCYRRGVNAFKSLELVYSEDTGTFVVDDLKLGYEGFSTEDRAPAARKAGRGLRPCYISVSIRDERPEVMRSALDDLGRVTVDGLVEDGYHIVVGVMRFGKPGGASVGFDPEGASFDHAGLLSDERMEALKSWWAGLEEKYL